MSDEKLRSTPLPEQAQKELDQKLKERERLVDLVKKACPSDADSDAFSQALSERGACYIRYPDYQYRCFGGETFGSCEVRFRYYKARDGAEDWDFSPGRPCD